MPSRRQTRFPRRSPPTPRPGRAVPAVVAVPVTPRREPAGLKVQVFHSCIASCLNAAVVAAAFGDEIAASRDQSPAPTPGAGLWSGSRVPMAHKGFRSRQRLRCNHSLWLRWSGRGSDGLRGLAGSGTGTGAARTARPARQDSPGSTLMTRPALVEHCGVGMPVMVAAVMSVVSGDPEAGEEDGRDDEQDAGHDHHPGSQSVEPIRFNRLGRWRGGNRGRRGWGFRCFTHASNDARASNSRG